MRQTTSNLNPSNRILFRTSIRICMLFSTCLSLLLLLVAEAGAQMPMPPGPRTAGPASGEVPNEQSIELKPSITHKTITLKGNPISYTATAAQLPIRSDAGNIECRMFYTAYTKDGVEPDQRPVTFAFNGGPGSATLWLHMGALGPRRAPMNDDGSLPKPPYSAVDNEETWLDFTDLVCIDAPATGYSRIVKPEYNSKYFGLTEDITAFSNFIRTWLKEHKRWRSPIFIAGESYGGIRGSGLCARLFDDGIAVSGFISISGTNNYLTLEPMRGNDASYIGFLPSLAACAWYHNKVSHTKYKTVAELVKEVTRWIDTSYAPALQMGDSMSETQRDQVADQLSHYVGLSKKYCLGAHLKIETFSFFRELLRDDGLTIGRYDGRLVGKEEDRSGFRGLGDPSDEAVRPPFTSAVNDYLDRELGVKTEMTYLLYGSVNPWKMPERRYPETASDLTRILLRNPHFRVLYCCGYYDLACPFHATEFVANHMGLDPVTRSHIEYAYYAAGHMMYIEKTSRKQLHDDAARFVTGTFSASR